MQLMSKNCLQKVKLISVSSSPAALHFTSADLE